MYPLSITVLSIRFELRGYLNKVTAGGWCEKWFPSGWPISPNENKLASNEVFGVKLQQTIIEC